MESPSKVAVPRPISSRMTSERGGRLVEDRGGLDHLHHEGGAAAREIVGRADAREQPVDDADAGAARPARKLPICASTVISAFWRRKVDLPAMLGPVSSQMRPAAASGGEVRSQSLATKRPLSRDQRLLHHRMPAAHDRELEAAVDDRPHVVPLDRQRGERRRDVEHRQRVGGGLDLRARRRDACGQRVEDVELEAERAVGGAGDLGLELADLGRGEAHLAGERLAVDEGCVRGRAPGASRRAGPRPR